LSTRERERKWPNWKEKIARPGTGRVAICELTRQKKKNNRRLNWWCSLLARSTGRPASPKSGKTYQHASWRGATKGVWYLVLRLEKVA